MGLSDKEILSVGSDKNTVAEETVESLINAKEDAELISIYYGSDVSEEDAEHFRGLVEEQFPSCDVELQFGGQPIYYYVMSIE